MYEDDSGRECVPVCPHPDYAAALAHDAWSNCSPAAINLESFLSNWITGMTKDDRMVAVFPTLHEKGIVLEPLRLEQDLLVELEQY